MRYRKIPFFFDTPTRRPARPRLECLVGKSLFMEAISARSPAAFGMWPAKEFKLESFGTPRKQTS